MSEIKTGEPDVKPDTPTHVKGVRTGNKVSAYKKEKGHRWDGRSTAKRSTGIRPSHHGPIVPGAPNISPP